MKRSYHVVTKQLKRFMKFVFYDIPGILYDYEPDGTGYLSLPRLMFGMAGLLIFLAYFREHLFGVPYENMSQLVAFFSAAAAGYVGKRFCNAKVTVAKHSRSKDTDPTDDGSSSTSGGATDGNEEDDSNGVEV